MEDPNPTRGLWKFRSLSHLRDGSARLKGGPRDRFTPTSNHPLRLAILRSSVSCGIASRPDGWRVGVVGEELRK